MTHQLRIKPKTSPEHTRFKAARLREATARSPWCIFHAQRKGITNLLFVPRMSVTLNIPWVPGVVVLAGRDPTQLSWFGAERQRALHFLTAKGWGGDILYSKGDVCLKTRRRRVNTRSHLFWNVAPSKNKPVSPRTALKWRRRHQREHTAPRLWYSPGCAVFTNLSPHCQIFDSIATIQSVIAT